MKIDKTLEKLISKLEKADMSQLTPLEGYVHNRYLCICIINREVLKVDFKGKEKGYKERMIDLIIANEAKKFKFQFKNIRMIILGKLKQNKYDKAGNS